MQKKLKKLFANMQKCSFLPFCLLLKNTKSYKLDHNGYCCHYSVYLELPVCIQILALVVSYLNFAMHFSRQFVYGCFICVPNNTNIGVFLFFLYVFNVFKVPMVRLFKLISHICTDSWFMTTVMNI